MLLQKTIAQRGSCIYAFRSYLISTSLLILIFIITGCQVHLVQPDPSDDSSLEANKAIIVRVYEEAFVQGNLAVVDELYSEDFVDLNPPRTPPDREGVKVVIERFQNAFDDFTVTVNRINAEGDVVITHSTFQGNHTNEYLGVSGTGKEISWDVVDFSRLKDGQIVEVWHSVDVLGLLRQLGYETVLPE